MKLVAKLSNRNKNLIFLWKKKKSKICKEKICLKKYNNKKVIIMVVRERNSNKRISYKSLNLGWRTLNFENKILLLKNYGSE